MKINQTFSFILINLFLLLSAELLYLYISGQNNFIGNVKFVFLGISEFVDLIIFPSGFLTLLFINVFLSLAVVNINRESYLMKSLSYISVLALTFLATLLISLYFFIFFTFEDPYTLIYELILGTKYIGTFIILFKNIAVTIIVTLLLFSITKLVISKINNKAKLNI